MSLPHSPAHTRRNVSSRGEDAEKIEQLTNLFYGTCHIESKLENYKVGELWGGRCWESLPYRTGFKSFYGAMDYIRVEQLVAADHFSLAFCLVTGFKLEMLKDLAQAPVCASYFQITQANERNNSLLIEKSRKSEWSICAPFGLGVKRNRACDLKWFDHMHCIHMQYETIHFLFNMGSCTVLQKFFVVQCHIVILPVINNKYDASPSYNVNT
ncbi:hypothetical protein BDR06DRAFT_974008 [Suillus hirtellus]|nr:hypothetical protein BDR06DRAFT_974008 [Suillus hirtellus]